MHSETEALLVCQHSLREEHAWKKNCSIALKAEDETLNCSPAIAMSPLCNHNHIFFFSSAGSLVTYGGRTPRPTPRPALLGII